jgi:DNA invertase Pin-like site-specific DNA recombinase
MPRNTKASSLEDLPPPNGYAVSYMRTSSATNVGGDSAQRQRQAIHNFAVSGGIAIAAEFYDAAVSGADPLDEREGFTDLLAFCKAERVTTVLVETAGRFARSLMVQELGLQLLRREGIQLVAVDSPDTFAATDDPMVEAIRQMLGVMAQLEKAMTVAKLKGARDRASNTAGRRIEGRKGYGETNPELVKEAKRLARKNPKTGKVRSLREIAAELAVLGFNTVGGKEFSASQVQRLIGK